MPVTVTGQGFNTFIEGIKRKLESPDLIQTLGDSLANALRDGFQSSGLQSRSGATLAALTYVGEPERIGNGWRIGVGNAGEAGRPEDPAPSGTLRAFFNDNPDIRPTRWRGLKPAYKDQLEAMRRAGMYGGRGPNYANYLWAQNYGSSGAEIVGRNYIDPTIETWRQRVPDMIQEFFRAQA